MGGYYRGHVPKPFSKRGARGDFSMTELERCISEWMEFLFIQKGHQPRGVERYAENIRAFFGWLSGLGREVAIRQVDRKMIDGWLRSLYLDQGNVSGKTRASKLSAVKSFFSWCVYSGFQGHNPTEGIPTPKFQRNLPQKFSTDDLRHVFMGPDRSTFIGVRDLAILMTLYAAGPRASELVNLDVNHVSDTGGYMRLRFVRGKGNKDRTITMQMNPSKALREWLVIRSGYATDHKAVFVSVNKPHQRLTTKTLDNVLQKYTSRVGIADADVFLHKMRSTFASDLYDSGDDHCPRCKAPIRSVDLLQVMLALGHEKPETTMGYIAISERHLKKTAIPDKRFKEILG